MIVTTYIREEKDVFVFKGRIQEHEVELVLIKVGGEMLINADDASRVFGNYDFGDLLSKDEDLSNAFLDDLSENYVEFSNAQMLLIMQDINKIDDKDLRFSLISKLGVQ